MEKSTMPVIGHFCYDAREDTYAGTINTLTISHIDVRFSPTGKFGNRAPDYRVVAEAAGGSADIGAAWRRTSDTGREYLSVTLDDPALPGPLHAALFQGDDGAAARLVWNRAKPDFGA
jgi:uncharacterized protein (DUF736 family)